MQWLTNLFGWLAKPFADMPANRRRRLLGWAVHILLVVLIVAALAAINYYAGLERVLRTRWLGIEHVWLPLLFLLGYALFWLLRWLWLILGPEGEAGEFDDIEKAWAEARAELDRAGIALTDTPVFLVLGRPAGPLEQVFAATRMAFRVRHVPREGEHPLHVYASRDAIFVTCEAASLLAAQAARLLEAGPAAAPLSSFPVIELEQPPSFPMLDLPGSTPSFAMIDLDQSPEAAPKAAAPAVAPAVAPTDSSANVLLLSEPPTATPRPAVRRTPLLRDPQVVDLQSRRLRHVCRLLVRDRRPYCPVNGILILLPLAATASAEDASETAAVLRHDLDLASQALQLDCPRFAVLCDVERIPGFAVLASHFREGRAAPSWLLGQHFPLAPDVPAVQVPAVIESGLTFITDTMLPLVIGRLLRREGEPGGETREQAIRANVQLYDFIRECRARVALFARLLSRAFTPETNAPPMLGGGYLAGTGADERDQAFLAGVIRRLLQHQNAVRWTDDALAEDADYRRYAFLGYVAVAVFLAAVALILSAW
jgi:hypothetical protein